jgi:ubiquitin-protein ligase
MAAASAPPASRQQASSMALRRLRRDLEILLKSPNPQICVRPAEDNLLEWHFVLHSLPADTPYHGYTILSFKWFNVINLLNYNVN